MPRLPVFRIHPLLAVSLLLAALVALPVGSVLFNVVQGGSEGTGAVRRPEPVQSAQRTTFYER